MASIVTRKEFSGGSASYTIPFPYLDKDHVFVYVNDVLDLNYIWSSDSIITFTSGNIPALEDTVIVERITPDFPLVDFQNGAPESGENLDIATRQALYLVQEGRIAAGDSLSIGTDGEFDAGGAVLKGLTTVANDLTSATTVEWVLLRLAEAVSDLDTITDAGVAMATQAATDAEASNQSALLYAQTSATASVVSENARDDALTHLNSTVTAKNSAEAYSDAAEIAKNQAETARDDAYNIFTDLIGSLADLETATDPIRIVKGEAVGSKNGMYSLEAEGYIKFPLC